MADDRVIKTIESPDGKARIIIVKRDDGFYSFHGEMEMGDGNRSPCDFSGLYGSADAAEKGAQVEVLWLRDTLTASHLDNSPSETARFLPL